MHSLNDLPLEDREQFLSDMSILGDAIIYSCNPIRVNYDILGNTDNYLHAHVFPRFEWEKEERRRMPVWLYDSSNWQKKETAYNPKKHDEIRNSILDYLNNHYS